MGVRAGWTERARPTPPLRRAWHPSQGSLGGGDPAPAWLGGPRKIKHGPWLAQGPQTRKRPQAGGNTRWT